MGLESWIIWTQFLPHYIVSSWPCASQAVKFTVTNSLVAKFRLSDRFNEPSSGDSMGLVLPC
jgi:hypothetical protein